MCRRGLEDEQGKTGDIPKPTRKKRTRMLFMIRVNTKEKIISFEKTKDYEKGRK